MKMKMALHQSPCAAGNFRRFLEFFQYAEFFQHILYTTIAISAISFVCPKEVVL